MRQNVAESVTLPLIYLIIKDYDAAKTGLLNDFVFLITAIFDPDAVPEQFYQETHSFDQSLCYRFVC